MLGCDLHCGYCQNWVTSQALRDPLLEVAGGDEFAESLGRGGEAIGHADARRGEPADHFAQRGVLAADLLEVGHAQIS